MISFKIKKYNFDAKTISQVTSSKEFNAFAYSELKRFMEPYNPSITNAQSAYIDKDGLIYPGPYAHYLWEGRLMVSPTTGSSWAQAGETKVYAEPTKALHFKRPGAVAHWDEQAMLERGDDFVDELGMYLIKKIGGTL